MIMVTGAARPGSSVGGGMGAPPGGGAPGGRRLRGGVARGGNPRGGRAKAEGSPAAPRRPRPPRGGGGGTADPDGDPATLPRLRQRVDALDATVAPGERH